MTAALLVTIGIVCCLLAAKWLPRPPIAGLIPATADNSIMIRIPDARDRAAALESELVEMTRDRNSWRERAEVAIHVSNAPRTIYAPRCECAECRHVRGG